MQLQSTNLTMHQITQDDWELFHTLHTDSRIIELCFDQPSLEDIDSKFASRLPEWKSTSDEWLTLVIQEKTSGDNIGITGFKVTSGVAEVGYLLLPEYSGKGYCTESLKALINWASNCLDIKQFRAVVTKGNVGSEKVLIKCGFMLTQIEPNAYSINGKLYDDHIFSLEKLIV